MTSQPTWKLECLTDTWALYLDLTGIYPPECEVWEERDESDTGLIYRFAVERWEEVPTTRGGGATKTGASGAPEYPWINLVHAGWSQRDPERHAKLEPKVDEIGMTFATRCACGATFTTWSEQFRHYQDEVLPKALSAYNEWFNSPPDRWHPQGGLAEVARCSGREVAELRAALCSEDVQDRLHAYLDVGLHHGFVNLDAYPSECTAASWAQRRAELQVSA